ncbi:transglutaminase domain-containing protein [Singulisphaera sp. Ch08]|uniref:Transglutaminase domain-containing protein n=1 Tax=Singulisphaera sp. Ch08 TaxID=3120278 RepID=A0AAU7CBZ2_9BACT
MRRTRRGLGFGLLVLSLGAVVATDTASAETHESWDAVFISGAKVGFIHTYVEPLKDKGKSLVRVRQDMEFTFKRLDDRVTIKTMYGTIETPEGSVLKLETRTLASNQQMTASGSVVDDKMTLSLDGGGQRQQVTIPWGPEVRGPYAAEQSLSRSPMKPGETRDLRMYVPDLNKICEIKLVAKSTEEVTLGDGKRPLLRIEELVSLGTKPVPEYNTSLWVDSGGQVLKSRSEILGGLDIYRTTREGARLGGDQASLNLTISSIVRVTHKIAKPETRRDVTYRVGLTDEDPATILPTDRRQSTRPGTTKNSSLLDVKTARPTDGTAGPETVDPQFLRANSLITSEDLTVKQHAVKATAGAVDPWDKAVKITKWVAQNLKDKNFETAFAPASEVAQTLAGDCTEHGVLVAAMCRAVGVPSRVVVGLVYSDSLGGFGFHMWNEVYVNRRWVAVDAAFDQTEVDAVHIKLADTSLDGVSPYEAFLPVVRVLGKMTIEPLELR